MIIIYHFIALYAICNIYFLFKLIKKWHAIEKNATWAMLISSILYLLFGLIIEIIINEKKIYNYLFLLKEELKVLIYMRIFKYIIFLFIATLIVCNKPIVIHKTIKKTTIIKPKTTSLKDLLIKHNVHYPEIALAQAKIETGHFKSPIFKKLNNAFGMHYPRKRKNKVAYKKGIMAGYNTIEDAVIDYKLWQEYVKIRNPHVFKTKEAYMDYLNRNYSAVTYYKTLIKKMLS